MAFPVIQETLDQAINTAAATSTINLPAAVNAGELLLLFASNHTQRSYFTPTGWSLLYNEGNSNYQRFACFALVAGGTEGGTTVTLDTDGTWDSQATRVMRISDWHGSLDAIRVVTPLAVSGGSSTVTFDPAQTAWTTSDTLWIAAASLADDGESFSGYSTGYSGGSFIATAAGANNSTTLGTAWLNKAADTETPGNFSAASSEAWMSTTVAIAPVGATVENQIPVITLTGATEYWLTVGDVWNDPGATADDYEDGNLTASITIGGTVNTTTAGDYPLTYDVSDSAGAAAVTQDRLVHVTAETTRTPDLLERLSQSWLLAGTSHVIDMPASVPAGQLLLILFSAFSNGARTTPTGWTRITGDSWGSGTTDLYARVADGSEGGTTVDVVTDVMVHAAAIVHRISEWEGTLAGGIEAVISYTTGTTVPVPSLSPSWGKDDYLWLVLLTASDDDQQVSIFPDNYLNGINQLSQGGSEAGCTAASAYRYLTAPTDSPTDITLQSSEESGTYLVAIKPYGFAGIASLGAASLTQTTVSPTVKGGANTGLVPISLTLQEAGFISTAGASVNTGALVRDYEEQSLTAVAGTEIPARVDMGALTRTYTEQLLIAQAGAVETLGRQDMAATTAALFPVGGVIARLRKTVMTLKTVTLQSESGLGMGPATLVMETQAPAPVAGASVIVEPAALTLHGAGVLVKAGVLTELVKTNLSSTNHLLVSVAGATSEMQSITLHLRESLLYQMYLKTEVDPEHVLFVPLVENTLIISEVSPILSVPASDLQLEIGQAPSRKLKL